MSETIKSLLTSIENNSLIVTLFSGGIIVTLFMNAKSIIISLRNKFLTLISFTIVNRYNTQYCEPDMLKRMLFLLNNKSKILWMNQVELMDVNNDNCDDCRSGIAAMPHGISYRLLYGKFIIVDKFFETEGMKMTTTITIRVFFCLKKTFFKHFLNDIKTTSIKESNDNVLVGVLNTYVKEKPKRSIKSLYSSNGAPEKLLIDVQKFLNNKNIYDQCEIPFKRNYLLYGKPGTGKSSSVLALASEINWDIMCIDITKHRLDDIIRCVNSRKNTIFLFEDVDALTSNITTKRSSNLEDKNKLELQCESSSDISLGQLLNLTDGLITPSGSICIFTTNHIETLDDAFIRDGRMDQKIEFNYFNSDTVNDMINGLLGFRLENPKDDVCPATLQESILQVKTGNKTTEEFKNEWSV